MSTSNLTFLVTIPLVIDNLEQHFVGQMVSLKTMGDISWDFEFNGSCKHGNNFVSNIPKYISGKIYFDSHLRSFVPKGTTHPMSTLVQL